VIVISLRLSTRLRTDAGSGGLNLGSQENDRWEMKILGPNAFERSYVLEGSRGEHRPERVRGIVGRLVGKG
jgi:hypothetical protein